MRQTFAVGRRNPRSGRSRVAKAARRTFLVGRQTFRGTTVLVTRRALSPIKGPWNLKAVVSGR